MARKKRKPAKDKPPEVIDRRSRKESKKAKPKQTKNKEQPLSWIAHGGSRSPSSPSSIVPGSNVSNLNPLIQAAIHQASVDAAKKCAALAIHLYENSESDAERVRILDAVEIHLGENAREVLIEVFSEPAAESVAEESIESVGEGIVDLTEEPTDLTEKELTEDELTDLMGGKLIDEEE